MAGDGSTAAAFDQRPPLRPSTPGPAPEQAGRGHDPAVAASTLVADFSLGVTWKEIGDLEGSRAAIPPGTPVLVGFHNEDTATRVSTVRAVQRSGFVPVPVIAARRLRSEAMLREYLAGVHAADASERVVVVGGDPEPPRGPYPDAASVIASGLLEEHGVRRVSVAGHPGGHPAIADSVRWTALAGKAAALEQRGLESGVVTQFGFDPARVLSWLADLRARGLTMPVRIGVPGPANVRQLLAGAAACGVTVSPPVARQYGFSPADLTQTAGPGRFIGALASGYDAGLHGDVKLHFNPFSGVAATAEWISQFRGSTHDATPSDGLLSLAARSATHPTGAPDSAVSRREASYGTTVR